MGCHKKVYFLTYVTFIYGDKTIQYLEVGILNGASACLSVLLVNLGGFLNVFYMKRGRNLNNIEIL